MVLRNFNYRYNFYKTIGACMDKKELQQKYKIIETYYNKYLKKHDVKLPTLYRTSDMPSKDALVLIYLSENYPKTREVSKEELTKFIKKFYPDTNDVQQARHLSMQKGWYIVSGTRGDAGISKGSYKLISLEKPYPGYCQERREGFRGDFESIKKKYDYRCATCGSKEGTEHLFRKGVIVQLQEGHMNPAMPLEEGNIIPQCQICNRPDRNKWVFDKTGRVIAVAITPDGIRIVKEFLKNSTSDIRIEIMNYLKSLSAKH